MLRHHHSLFITPPTPNPLPACSLHCTQAKSHVRQPAKSTRSIHSKGEGWREESKRGERERNKVTAALALVQTGEGAAQSYYIIPTSPTLQLPSPDCGTLSIVFDTKFVYICMYIYVYTYVYVYIYKHIKLQHLFHGATVSIPRTWYMAVPKKKRK